MVSLDTVFHRIITEDFEISNILPENRVLIVKIRINFCLCL